MSHSTQDDQTKPMIDNSKQKNVSKFEQHFFNKCIALNKDEWLEKGRV